MYKAIAMFRDLRDNGYTYLPGDTYPRDGYAPEPERIQELAGDSNARGYPLIAEADDKRPTRKRVRKNE